MLEPKNSAISGGVILSNLSFKMDDGILADNIMNLGHHALLSDPSILKSKNHGWGPLSGFHCNNYRAIYDGINVYSWPSFVTRR